MIVDCSEGSFAEHPESYSPRIFVSVNVSISIPHKTYELLRDGQTIVWPCPPKRAHGLDFWLLIVNHLSDVNMIRDAVRDVPQADGDSSALGSVLDHLPEGSY